MAFAGSATPRMNSPAAPPAASAARSSVAGGVLFEGAVLLLSFAALEYRWLQSGRLPESVYRSSWILGAALHWPIVQAQIVYALAVAALYRSVTWSASDGSKRPARLVALSAVMVLTWAFAANGYNYWMDEWYALDRLMLVALCALCFWTPAFIPLFAVQLNLLIGQWNYPLDYSWTDKLPVVEMVYLAALAQPLRRLRQDRSHLFFIYAAMVLWGAFYVAPGLAKLRIHWLVRNESANIIYGAWLQNGWLSSFDEAGIRSLAAVASTGAGGLKFVVLAIELGAAVLLGHRTLAVAILAAAVAMHAGIFAMSGILFWKWMIVDVAWVIALVGMGRDTRRRLFSIPNAVAATALVAIFLLRSWSPVWLGWLDTRLFYRFEISGRSGDRSTQIPARAFAPFDIPFSQGGFYFLTRTPRLVDCLGAASSEAIADAADTVSRDPGQLPKVRDELGHPEEDPAKRVVLREFLRKYAEERRSPHGAAALRWLQPPLHIWSGAQPFAPYSLAPRDVPLDAISISLSEWALSDGRIVKLNGEELMTVVVGAD